MTQPLTQVAEAGPPGKVVVGADVVDVVGGMVDAVEDGSVVVLGEMVNGVVVVVAGIVVDIARVVAGASNSGVAVVEDESPHPAANTAADRITKTTVK